MEFKNLFGIKDFLSKFKGGNSCKTTINNKDSNNITNYGELVSIGNNSGCKTNNGTEVYIGNVEENSIVNIYTDTHKNKESTIVTPLSKEIDEIKKMDNYSTNLNAIDKYNELLIFNSSTITDEDKFEIIISIFSIYVNLNDKRHIEEYIKNINKLPFKDEERISKALSIYYFNIQEFEKCEEMLSKKSYSQSDPLYYILYLSVRCMNNKFSYEEFVNTILDDYELKEEFKKDNISNLYNIIGNVSREKHEYTDLIKLFEKSLEIHENSRNMANLAMAYYLFSIKDTIENDKVTSNRVYYKELVKSKQIIEKVIKLSEKESDIDLFNYSFNVYIQILSLLGNINTALDKLHNLSFQHKDENLKETERILEYIFKDRQLENLEEISTLTEGDILLRDINVYLKSEKYKEIINLLEPIILQKYKMDLRFHYILLSAYLIENQKDKFVEHLRKVESLGKESNMLLKVKFDYYLKENNFESAKQCLVESIEKYNDPSTYYDLASLYYKFEKDIEFKELIGQILGENDFVLDLLYIEIYNIYFDWLFKNNLYLEAKEMLDKCDKTKFGIINFTNKGGIIYSEIGDYDSAIDVYEKGYTETKAPNYLYGLACSYMQCNNLDKAEETLLKLLNTDFEKKEYVYAMLSNIEVLRNNLIAAFEYCENAKTIVENIPYSEIHSFYTMRSIRCNEIDSSVIHMSNFVQNYPKIDNWVKTITAVETDDEGNESLTPECLSMLKSSLNSFENKLYCLKNGLLGFVNMTKSGEMYDSIFEWKDIYNIKVNVNSGNTNELQVEYDIKCNELVIDAIGLYILRDIENLELLQNMKKVYITYSTLEYLNLMLLNRENEKIRDIITFIKQSINVVIVPMNYKLYKVFEGSSDTLFEKYTLDALCYSKINNIPYYYGEYVLNVAAKAHNINSIGILSLLRKETLENKALVVSKLRYSNYKFINFNYEDMYYCAKKFNFQDCKEIRYFFIIDDGGDIISFIRHFLIFLYAVYKNNNSNFENMYKLFIESMSSLYKKTIYSEVVINYLKNRQKTYGNITSFKRQSQISLDKFNKDLGLLKDEDIYRLQTNSYMAIQYTYDFFKDETEFKHYLNIIQQIVNTELFNKLKKPITAINSSDYTKNLDSIINKLK